MHGVDIWRYQMNLYEFLKFKKEAEEGNAKQHAIKFVMLKHIFILAFRGGEDNVDKIYMIYISKTHILLLPF